MQRQRERGEGGGKSEGERKRERLIHRGGKKRRAFKEKEREGNREWEGVETVDGELETQSPSHRPELKHPTRNRWLRRREE